MIKFEVAKGWEDKNIHLPERKTAGSAGYDFEVAEDTLIPPYENLVGTMVCGSPVTMQEYSLEGVAAITKAFNTRPTLVPTGIKAAMPQDLCLVLSIRSSSPLKHWLVLANGEGLIDSDYYQNPDNDGHIMCQIINFSPYPIMLRKGDIIGQGKFIKYYTTDDDAATASRTGGFGSTTNA